MRHLTIDEALALARAAHKAAGSPTTPCYDPTYLVARELLADAHKRAEKQRRRSACANF